MRAGLLLLLLLGLVRVEAAEVHGKVDVFTAPGVSLAWAVARGADEAKTFVVIRVVPDLARFRALSVTGRDPFSKADKVLVAPTPLTAKFDVRLPRAGFAEFPRTELRFLDAAGKLQLEVYYLGVPDTTPEFADSARLEAYLGDRTSQLKP
jgi:hypothetical protein